MSGMQGIKEPSTARQKSSEKLSFQMTADIINELKDLFLTDITVSYCKSWERFKKIVHRVLQIMIDMTQLNQLISMIKELVKQQKFSSVTSTKLLIIYTSLLAENAAWSESSQIHEVLTCLSHELVITISNVTLQDRNQSIKQIVKKINKTKRQKIQKKVLMIHRLFNRDVIASAIYKISFMSLTSSKEHTWARIFISDSIFNIF